MSTVAKEADARSSILAAVRRAHPAAPVALPAVLQGERLKSSGGLGYQGSLDALEKVDGEPAGGQPLEAFFAQQLKAMGGSSERLGSKGEAQAKVKEMFPEAKVVCSVVPEVKGNRTIDGRTGSTSVADVEVFVVESSLGVAEAGAVWFADQDLVVPSTGVLTQHLVVLLESSKIVPTLHEAYDGRVDFAAHPYSVFMAGPSATGDIEGVIIHGAQGARSLCVLLYD